jgi:hypothetical protein
MAIEELKRHKSPGFEKIPAELSTAGGRKIRSEFQSSMDTVRLEQPTGCQPVKQLPYFVEPEGLLSH